MYKILFITTTHGNEAFSIPVLRDLEDEFPKRTYQYDWLIANPRALALGVRFVDADMNRSAPGRTASLLYEEKRVAEVIEIAKEFDIVVDIHGSLSNCGITTLIPLPTRQNIHLARAFDLERNVIWYSERSKENGPISQYVKSASIELECGPKYSPEIARQLRDVLARILLHNYDGTLLNKTPANKSIDFYNVYGKVIGDKASKKMKDFIEINYQKETFFPYLSGNTYPNIICYKMKKLKGAALDDAILE